MLTLVSRDIVPASHRSGVIHSRPLLLHLKPILDTQVDTILAKMKGMVPLLKGSDEGERAGERTIIEYHSGATENMESMFPLAFPSSFTFAH